MKKVLFTIVTLLLLSANGTGQWYNRRYGVNSINQLSKEQLNEALIWVQNKVTGGIVLSVVGAIGIGTGSYLIAHSKKIYPEANDITEQQMSGFLFLVISVPVEIAGLTKWGVNSTRAKSIKAVLKSTELKMGLVNDKQKNMFSGSQGPLSPGFSITICF